MFLFDNESIVFASYRAAKTKDKVSAALENDVMNFLYEHGSARSK